MVSGVKGLRSLCGMRDLRFLGFGLSHLGDVVYAFREVWTLRLGLKI